MCTSTPATAAVPTSVRRRVAARHTSMSRPTDQPAASERRSAQMLGPADIRASSPVAPSHFAFAAVAIAFATAMAFTTVPTPLWSLYAQRDRFSSLMVTIVFAVYAVAVAVSLFLAGHLSDSYGRRRVLMPALALEGLAGVVFLASPSLPGLLLGRVLSGLGVGAVTATATAWLSDLGRSGSRRAQLVATGAAERGAADGGDGESCERLMRIETGFHWLGLVLGSVGCGAETGLVKR